MAVELAEVLRDDVEQWDDLVGEEYYHVRSQLQGRM